MARNRATGEGTIYRRKDGRWEVAIKCPTTAGKRKRIRAYTATRAEADRKLTELKHQVEQGVPVPDKTWKLAAYLDYWIADIVPVDRRPATLELYEATVRLNLKPALGGYSLQQLTVPIVQQFINQQIEEGHYSLRKVQVMRTVLSAALTNAMREELLTRNVARLVRVKKWERGNEIVPWTADEIRAFLSAAEPHPYYAVFLLAGVYGTRRGESLGLRWSDVDTSRKRLHIRQQLQRLSSGLHIGPVKTDSGERVLPLLPMIREALDARREAQLADQLSAGAAWQSMADGEALIFTSRTGHPIEPKNVNRALKRICKAHGIREIRFHDMRHSVATLLKDLGVPSKDIQAILGHASVVTTQNVYEHANLEASERALSKVEALLSAGQSSGNSSLTAGLDSSGGRQVWPSNNISDVAITTVVSGGPIGIRTRDTLLKRTISLSGQQGWADIHSRLLYRTCALHVGFVAVNCGRQIFIVPLPTQVRRIAPRTSSGLHAMRCASSPRNHSQRRMEA